MVYTPAIPLGGLIGWRVFNQSIDRQFETYSSSEAAARDVAYFKENIADATSAVKLIEDRRLLSVALGAFGLEDEINKKAIIRKVLQEGTDLPNSFANRLSDTKWREFSKEFGYGNFDGARVDLDSLKNFVSQQYLERSFEARVGDVDTNMRLAMNFRREVARIAVESSVETIGWFRIMGSKTLRTVAEAGFGLPKEFGLASIDKQKEEFEDRASKLFGGKSPAIFTDPEVVDAVIRNYFLRAEIASGPSASTRGQGAISLLTSSPESSAQTINLILSNAR